MQKGKKREEENTYKKTTTAFEAVYKKNGYFII